MQTRILSLLLAVCALFALTACGKTEPPAADVWADAIYTENAEVGEGGTTFTVDVTAGDKTVTLTVRTDADTVGEALLENGVIEGEDGQYGLYITKVNGMIADYDTDGTYWAFYENGDYAAAGVDMTPITADTAYGLTKAKG